MHYAARQNACWQFIRCCQRMPCNLLRQYSGARDLRLIRDLLHLTCDCEMRHTGRVLLFYQKQFEET